MTITFLTRRFFPQIGGVETHVMEIAKALVKEGNRVIIITEAPQSLKENKGSISGLEIFRVNAGKEDWFKKIRIWRGLWSKRYLIEQSDIVHCHDVFYWYLPYRLLYFRKKVYTTFHGYEGKVPPSFGAVLMRKISEKLSSGNIIVGDYIKKWYGTKSTFITYGGVNVDRIKNLELRIKNSKSKLKIVLIGRLENDIGVNTYLKSLDLLEKQKIKFNFTAIGEGSFEKRVKKYGRVISFQKDLTKYIMNSDVIFCSSYLAMLQAIISRKPVIAVFENKLKEDYLRMSPFSRIVYICKDPEEVVKVLQSIKDHSWKGNSMIENGYQWASEQTWNNVVLIYKKLWKA